MLLKLNTGAQHKVVEHVAAPHVLRGDARNLADDISAAAVEIERDQHRRLRLVLEDVALGESPDVEPAPAQLVRVADGKPA